MAQSLTAVSGFDWASKNLDVDTLLESLPSIGIGANDSALIYNAIDIECSVQKYRETVGEHGLGFAVKANRTPSVLSYLASVVDFASVSSVAEYSSAKTAGFDDFRFVFPGDSHTLRRVVGETSGGVVFCNSIPQFKAYVGRVKSIGLRVRTDPASRFGIEIGQLSTLSVRERGRISHVLGHVANVSDIAQLHSLIGLLREAILYLPRVETVSLGGGMIALFRNVGARQVRQVLSTELLPYVQTFELEPGADAVMGSGYVVCNVVSVSRNSNFQEVTLDVSVFSLNSWTDIEFVGCRFVGAADRRRVGLSRIAGPTCYEGDVWLIVEEAREFVVGDRLIFRGFGAYSAGMFRPIHGLQHPTEVLVSIASNEDNRNDFEGANAAFRSIRGGARLDS
ncbi:hypothetical protein [Rhodococcus sp. 2G]|uniref:hypothetical protein n=1 Tax=Rhodococcus sp. 2G TaxID=1570939 RepID=UPI0012EBB332|nr:hypothetical protein [Rhodococcus sp. 2G]